MYIQKMKIELQKQVDMVLALKQVSKCMTKMQNANVPRHDLVDNWKIANIEGVEGPRIEPVARR